MNKTDKEIEIDKAIAAADRLVAGMQEFQINTNKSIKDLRTYGKRNRLWIVLVAVGFGLTGYFINSNQNHLSKITETQKQTCIDGNSSRGNIQQFLDSIFNQDLSTLQSEKHLIPASEINLYNQQLKLIKADIVKVNKDFGPRHC